MWAARSDRASRAAIAGVAVGLTILAHTAPALVLAPIGLALLKPKHLLICGTVAAAIASPFVLAILGHYHLHIVNRAPMDWHYGPLMWTGFSGTIRAHAAWFVVAAIGLWWVHSRVVVVWIVSAAILLLWSMTGSPIVPAFHFWIYLMGAVLLLCGVAVANVCRFPVVVILITIACVRHAIVISHSTAS